MSSRGALVVSPEYLGTRNINIVVGPEAVVFTVHRTLLCARCPFFHRLYKKPEYVKDFKNPEGKVETHSLLMQYLYHAEVPSGPEGVRKDSVEAKFFIHQMHELHLLAKDYQSRDLMNRVMDHIQAFDKICGRTAYSSRLEQVYNMTVSGSKLRWYYAAASACFLARATDSRSVKRRHDKIMDFRAREKNFKADLGRARNCLKVKIEVQKLDYRDQASFGTCEFHTHQARDMCHRTGHQIQASTITTRATRITPASAPNLLVRSVPAGQCLGVAVDGDSSSEDNAGFEEERVSGDRREDEDVEIEDISRMDLDTLEEGLTSERSPGHSDRASMLPETRNSQQTPESIVKEESHNRYRERAPSAETKFGDVQMNGPDVQEGRDLNTSTKQKSGMRNTHSKPRRSRKRGGQKPPPHSNAFAAGGGRTTKSFTPSRVSSKRIPPVSVQKTPTHIFFVSDEEENFKIPSSFSASRRRVSLDTYSHDKQPASVGNRESEMRQFIVSPTRPVLSPKQPSPTALKTENFEDIYNATPTPPSLGVSQIAHDPARNRNLPPNAPKGPRGGQSHANRSGIRNQLARKPGNQTRFQGVRKCRGRGGKRYRGRPNEPTGAASTPSTHGFNSLVILKPGGWKDLLNVHKDRIGRMTYERATRP